MLSLYVFSVSDPCKYLFSTNSWKLRSCTGEEWSLQSWRLNGKNRLPDVKEEVAVITLSTISERHMLILKLSVEREERINFFFSYWWILIALKKPVQLFPKLESCSTELPKMFWHWVSVLSHLSYGSHCTVHPVHWQKASWRGDKLWSTPVPLQPQNSDLPIEHVSPTANRKM